MARENSEHGPGGTMREEGPIRQRKMMARDEGVMKGGDFGVEQYPGTRRIPGDHEIMGKELSDKERGCGMTVPMGGGYMDASRNPDHGEHGHSKAMFERAGRR